MEVTVLQYQKQASVEFDALFRFKALVSNVQF